MENMPKSQDKRYMRCKICGKLVIREGGMMAHMKKHKNKSKGEQKHIDVFLHK